MIATYTKHITGDDTDVFSGTWAENPPPWAKFCRVQVIAEDYDWLVDFSVGTIELMVNSAAHVFGTDNAAIPDWTKPHVAFPVSGGNDFDLTMNYNIVTAGDGLVCLQYEG